MFWSKNDLKNLQCYSISIYLKYYSIAMTHTAVLHKVTILNDFLRIEKFTVELSQ